MASGRSAGIDGEEISSEMVSLIVRRIERMRLDEEFAVGSRDFH